MMTTFIERSVSFDDKESFFFFFLIFNKGN